MAYDAFLKIEGITRSEGGVGEIEVLSFTSAVPTLPDRGLTPNAGAPRAIDPCWKVVKHTDGATPGLFLAAATGKRLGSATLTLVPAVQRNTDAAPGPFLRYTFGDSFIESVQWRGSESGDVRPLEEVEIGYRSLEVEVVDADGSVRKAGFDFATGRAIG